MNVSFSIQGYDKYWNLFILLSWEVEGKNSCEMNSTSRHILPSYCSFQIHWVDLLFTGHVFSVATNSYPVAIFLYYDFAYMHFCVLVWFFQPLPQIKNVFGNIACSVTLKLHCKN